MGYLVSSTASIQAVNDTQTSTQSLKYVLSALDVDYYNAYSIRLAPNVNYEILLSGIARIHALAIQSKDAIVDYAFGDINTVTPEFSTYGSNYTLRIINGGIVATKIYLTSTIATDVEVVVAGRAV